MKTYPQTRPLALASFVAWFAACAFSTSGQLSNGTGGQGGQASSSSGTGGGITLSTSSSGGAGGMTTSSSSSSSSSSGGCATGTKPCGTSCVADDDPQFGCAAAACDPCTNPHGTVGCSNGACSPSCDPGFMDCNNEPSDGCETDVGTTTDCGACGTACTNPHGTTACVAGACVPTCDPGFADCDNDPSNGCGADLKQSASDCGSCGHQCTNAHGGVACMNGMCKPTCDGGYADCDGDPDNGCETSTDTDLVNCGACKHACSSANVAALICSGGKCTSTCRPGFANCNMPGGADDGCEKDVTADNNNCGGCGNACGNNSIMDNPECDQGSGAQQFCGCSNNNECKWDSGTSPSCNNGLCTCGSTTCRPSEVCKSVSGQDTCTCYGGDACQFGESCCQKPLGCFNLQSDPANCGACGHACAPGFACNGGVCSCGATDAVCGGGAPAGTFSCPAIGGPDKCVCNSGATTCFPGQRCLADNTCG